MQIFVGRSFGSLIWIPIKWLMKYKIPVSNLIIIFALRQTDMLNCRRMVSNSKCKCNCVWIIKNNIVILKSIEPKDLTHGYLWWKLRANQNTQFTVNEKLNKKALASMFIRYYLEINNS